MKIGHFCGRIELVKEWGASDVKVPATVWTPEWGGAVPSSPGEAPGSQVPVAGPKGWRGVGPYQVM